MIDFKKYFKSAKILKKILIALMLITASTIPVFSIYSSKPSNKPNIIFFLVDDMGWTDLGCYGSKIYETPAIDKFAKEGVRFKNGYASHPMCIASRFSLMTGRYNAGNKHFRNTKKLELKQHTIAEAMKDAGYKTFFAGKWHRGKKGAYPENQGFDINIGGHKMGAPASYFYPYGKEGNARKVPGLDNTNNMDEYLTDRLTNETIKFIKDNKNKPFFAYLSHYAVHTPFHGKKEYVKEYKKKISKAKFQDPKHSKVKTADQKLYQDNATYAAMVKSIDESLAKIMSALKDLNLDENTIIIFTSDNGGDACKTKKRGRSTSNLPLKAGKCWLYEGGIRVPYIVRWKGKIKPSVSDYPVGGTDQYPTILELAGSNPIPEQHTDGQSIAPLLLGKKQNKREPMYWFFNTTGNIQKISGMEPAVVIREGNYKLIEWYKSGKYELYNLNKDIGEHNDLSSKKRQKAKKMLKRLRKWRKTNNIE